MNFIQNHLLLAAGIIIFLIAWALIAISRSDRTSGRVHQRGSHGDYSFDDWSGSDDCGGGSSDCGGGSSDCGGGSSDCGGDD